MTEAEDYDSFIKRTGLDECDYAAMVYGHKLAEKDKRIAELEAENTGLRQRWADMCAGMWKVELWEKGK